MRIAVACDDESTMAAHFGRCAGFAVFDISERAATPVEYRPNTGGHHQAHATGDHEHHHRAGAPDHHHSFIALIDDCGVVVCRGMGRRAVADLLARGIVPSIVSEDLSPREAAERYAVGRLHGSGESTCCSH